MASGMQFIPYNPKPATSHEPEPVPGKVRAKATLALSYLEQPPVQHFVDTAESHNLIFALQMAQSGSTAQNVLSNLSKIVLLPDLDPPQKVIGALGMIQDLIDELSELYKDYLAGENAIPGPSSFAQHDQWAKWQQKDTGILCFRPNGKQGLPLCVLHDVFRQFQVTATETLPSTLAAAQAMNAAFSACRRMPEHFDTEDERSEAFDLCLGPLFPCERWREQVHLSATSGHHGGWVDRTYEVNGVVHILREDKLEADKGDPYMHVARAYQLLAEKVRSKDPKRAKEGVPVFLLCLLGPMLLICGGFHGGKSTIVEPLAEPCLLFDDCLHRRQEVLARQLYALTQGVDTLSECRREQADFYLPQVPRIYPTYRKLYEQMQADEQTRPEEQKHGLKWLRPLAATHPRSLLMVATEDPKGLDQASMRMVKLVRQYGAEVHPLLATKGFAPQLHGRCSSPGAPTAYVMEYLSPPTDTEPGWITLSQFFKSPGATEYQEAIEKTLNLILTVMGDADVMHGDFRPNNIMLQVFKMQHSYTPVCSGGGQEANLKVVDFDWAGKSGSVSYPLQRNEDIAWPAAPWDRIIKDHDRELVNIWWREEFSSAFPDRRMAVE
ncbi:hypothetical protein FS837_007447 [Tulasnella sp. UAMH 9824]|nr:hypothetical protein FS837_007447 [Tulasnella sp. UAMH 9824]